MKKGFTRIAVVLDRSGSIATILQAMLDGFNEFIDSQGKEPGECTVKLVRFNDNYEEVFDKPLVDIDPLTASDLVPSGGTALRDAVAKTVSALNSEIDALDEASRPEKTIVVIMTDGEENMSKEFAGAPGAKRLGKIIKDMREKKSWEFVYVGSNQDALTVAHEMEIPASSSMTYAASASGTAATYGAVSNFVSCTRGGMKAAFTNLQRSAAMATDDDLATVTPTGVTPSGVTPKGSKKNWRPGGTTDKPWKK